MPTPRLRKVALVTGIAALIIAVAGLCLTLWLNGQQNARLHVRDEAQKAAREQTAPIVCHLVYAYTHPAVGTGQTGRSDQLIGAWHEVGVLVGCPLGVAPKGN